MSENILIITPGFPIDEQDDVCIPSLQLYLTALIDSEYNVNILVISLYYPFTAVEYYWKNIRVVALGYSQGTLVSRILCSFKAQTAILKHLNGFRPTLIHSFWINHTALLANRLSRKFKTPHIATMMGQDVFYTSKLRFLLKQKELCLIAVSEFQKDKSQISVNEVIHWGLPLSEFKVDQVRNIDVLGVGSLTKLKDYKKFIRIIGLVRHSKPDIKAVIVGEGPEKKQLDKLIKQLGLGNHISLLGLKPRNEVLEIMKQSKVLLHTSAFESFGMIFAEGLSVGMFTVSEKVGIAGIHPRSFVDVGENCMAKRILILLNLKRYNIDSNIFDVQETLDLYIKCYNRNLNKANRRIEK